MKLPGLLQGDGLSARSLRAGSLTMLQFGGGKALQLASNLILTRILFPEAFGLMALVSVFVLGLSLLSDVGVGPSVIRSARSDEPVFQSTAWTLQVVRGGLITVIAWALAWPYAQFYGAPELFGLISVAALSVLIKGFASIEILLHQRKLALGRLVVVQLCGQGLTTMITILLALWLQSVWALAIGFVLSAALATGIGHWVFPSASHRFAWDRAVLSEILVYGRWILLGTFFGYFGGQGIALVHGALVDLEVLAFLTIATTFALIPAEIQSAVFGAVVFPALSQVVRDRPGELSRVVRRVRRLQLPLAVLAFVALSFVARPLIGFLYDPRYEIAGTYLVLIALNSGLGVIPLVYQSALMASGDSRTHSFITGTAAVLRIAGTLLGFGAGGITGMLVGFGLASIATNLQVFWIAQRRGFGAGTGDALASAALLAAYGWQLWVLA